MNREIFERIDQLMTAQKKKNKDINDYLGLKQSTYDNWRRGKSTSFMKYLERIAEFLNVTPNYLVCGSDTVETIVDKRKQMEEKLIEMIRSVSDKEAETLMNLVKVYVSSLS